MHPALANHLGHAAKQPKSIRDRLFDFTGIRISEMDAAGIDVQILSHQSPGSQRLPDEVAIEACKNVNNALAKVIEENSSRFLGFSMLPTNLPIAAAAELKRSVEELGLKGAMIHGLSAGRMVDEEFFWPIFSQAEKLNVPIYLHPALPDKAVTARYYSPYDESHPMLIRAAWGFGVEAGTQAIRMILSWTRGNQKGRASPKCPKIILRFGCLSKIPESIIRIAWVPASTPNPHAALINIG